MTFLDYSNTIPIRRKVAVEACILAAIAESKRTLRVDEIRKFVLAQPGFENTQISSITLAVAQMCHRRRIVVVWQAMRTIPSYGLPELGAVVPEPLSMTAEARERQIIASMSWPRFFHLPCKEDLRPIVRNYSHHVPTMPG